MTPVSPATPTVERRRRVVIDTDPALGAPGADIDDGLAIAMALNSPELVVEALTVVNGNVDVTTGTATALLLLERLDRLDVPVYVGADRPLLKDMAPIRSAFATSLPPTVSTPPAVAAQATTAGGSGAEFLARTVMGNPGEITIVAIGPMTNLALAMRLEPGFADAVGELVLMAGAATTYAQNMTTVADFNAYVDPEALQIVLDSGAPIRMVGLDQTMRVRLTREHAAALRTTGDPFALWVAECTDSWIDYLHRAFPNRPEHATSCFLHDPLTVAAVLRPDLLTWAPARVDVECASPLTRGLVVADRGLSLLPRPSANALVAVDTDVEAFIGLFLDRVWLHPS